MCVCMYVSIYVDRYINICNIKLRPLEIVDVMIVAFILRPPPDGVGDHAPKRGEDGLDERVEPNQQRVHGLHFIAVRTLVLGC